MRQSRAMGYQDYIYNYPNYPITQDEDYIIGDLSMDPESNVEPVQTTARLNIGGLFALVLFYFLIFLVGMYAGWKGKKYRNPAVPDRKQSLASLEQDSGTSPAGAPIAAVLSPVDLTDHENYILAGRNIGWLVGTFTMTATWVGGGYINGTAEALYNPDLGLIWAQAPWGYALSLVIGGLCFASVMRGENFITMIDPFQKKYGDFMGVLLFLPALLAETLWSAAILAALGSSVTVMMDLSDQLSIISSACVVIVYTIFGGLYSVAYTDVVQLLLIFVGLWLVVPFALTHPNVSSLRNTSQSWIGVWDNEKAGLWVDYVALLIFGGIPWQVYFQRVLSAKSAKRAVALSLFAAIGCMFMALPAAIIGCIGASIKDWSKFGNYGNHSTPLTEGQGKNILPLVINYCTPPFVSWIGLGAVSAAVMSSADSSLLSASSMFTRNVYKVVIRPEAKEEEMERALKASILSVGVLAMTFALSINSIFDLWVMCSDFVYVILFPQLVAVIYMPQSNSYGSFAGYVVGFFFRVLGGIKVFGVPPIIKYFYFDHASQEQRFPFRTLSMTLSLASIFIVSFTSKILFEKKILPSSYDVFYCYNTRPNSAQGVQEKEKSVDVVKTQKKRECDLLGQPAVGSVATMSTYREPRSHRQLQATVC